MAWISCSELCSSHSRAPSGNERWHLFIKIVQWWDRSWAAHGCDVAKSEEAGVCLWVFFPFNMLSLRPWDPLQFRCIVKDFLWGLGGPGKMKVISSYYPYHWNDREYNAQPQSNFSFSYAYVWLHENSYTVARPAYSASCCFGWVAEEWNKCMHIVFICFFEYALFQTPQNHHILLVHLNLSSLM